jgi:hypothetical protein
MLQDAVPQKFENFIALTVIEDCRQRIGAWLYLQSLNRGWIHGLTPGINVELHGGYGITDFDERLPRQGVRG